MGDSDSDDATSIHNAVFIDTNLDTHLAVIVSQSDTVLDLKRKIMSEHPQCFPNFGEIKLNALKVKRKRCFYHLSDSMLVKSVFGGAKKCWFVSVDAFSLKQQGNNQFPIDPAVSNRLALVSATKAPSGDLYASPPGIIDPEFASGNTGKDVLNDVEMTNMGVGGEPWNTTFLDSNARSDLGENQGTHVECRNDKSRNTERDVDRNDSLVEEDHSKSKPVVKKKLKRGSKGAGNPLEGNETLLSNVIEETSKPKGTILENSIEEKLKTNTTTSDSLFTELPEDVLLVARADSGKKKSKKNKKLPTDQVFNPEPSSLHDGGKDSFEKNVGVVAKNSDMTSVAAIVSEINMQYGNLPGTFEVSRKRKHHESVQEVVEQDKLPSPSVDSLFMEPPEGGHLLAGSREKKKSKKKKLSADQLVDAEPLLLHDVGKEGSKENVVTVSKDSDKPSGLVIVSEQNVQHATLSGSLDVSQKQKHTKPVQELVGGHKLPSSLADVNLVAGSGSGKTKSKTKKKLPTDEVVDAEPSTLHDVGKEGSKENVGTLSKDSCKACEPVQKVVEGDKLPPSSADSLFTEPPEDVHLVADPSVGTKKCKKKKKLPTDKVVNVEPSSLHDVGKEGSEENVHTVCKDSDKAYGAALVSEQDVQHATLSGTVEVSQEQKHPEPAQEVVERYKIPSSSMGNNASTPDAANENGNGDAPELGARSRSKGRKTSKNRHSTNMEEFPSLAVNESDNLKKDDMQSRHEYSALDDHNFETCGPHKNEERKELPQNHDPETMLSEKSKPPIQGEADMHSKESVVSDNLFESTVIMESGKSAGSRKIKMRAKKSVATKVVSSMEHDDNSVSGTSSHVPRFDDHFDSEAKKEESFLSPTKTKRKKMSKRKTVDTSFVDANGQSDGMCGNEVESLPSTQVDKTQENAETSDGNLRKKAKKNENSDAKTFVDFPVKEQANEVESLQLNQVDMTRKDAENMDETSRNKTKKSQNAAAKEQEGGGEVLTPSSDMLRVVDTPSKTKKRTKSVKTSSKSQLTGQELELETNSFNPQQTLRTVDVTQIPSSDTLEGNSIGRPLQNDHDGNASKNSNMTDANYQREVSNCDGDRINFKDYFVPGEHKHEVTPVELVVDKVSKAKGSDGEVKTKKNAKKNVLISPASSHDPGNSLNSYVNQVSDRRSLRVSKASNKKMGEVVNSSRHEKSLLATPGDIFRDGSSESSEDESTTANSDSSTKAPSDNSSSSGYSEGNGKSNLDSPRYGISGAKDKDGGKSATKSQALSSKNFTLDRILRSSSRFKKAKLTASQPQLEDAESQPVDFVPDSQVNL